MGDWEYEETDERFSGLGLAEDRRHSSVSDHTDLVVWQASMDFAVQIYSATSSFPGEERYGLTSQMRRAAVSISANIAEGYGRGTTGAYVQFLRIAQGSTKEAQSLIELSSRLGFLSEGSRESLKSEAIRIAKMLASLIRAIEKSPRK